MSTPSQAVDPLLDELFTAGGTTPEGTSWDGSSDPELEPEEG